MSTFIPYVIKKDPRGNNQGFDIYSRLLEDRIIFLTGEVHTDSINSIIAQMLHLEAEDPETDIKFYINSPGGDVNSAFALYDTMQHLKCEISTIGVGLAASAGAFLLCSGTKGKRYVLPHSRVMIHQPHGGAQGQITDLEIRLDLYRKSKERMTEIIAENSKKSYEEVYDLMERDKWFIGKEAQEFGLVDKVIS